jgi:magnesium transporter
MGRIVRRAVKRPGTPPGTLVASPPRWHETPQVREIRYSAEAFDESERSIDQPLDLAEARAPQDPGGAPTPGVLWLNVDGVHDVALLERIGHAAGIHPLALEDVATVGQRPKFEEYDEHLFLVLHMLRLHNGDHLDGHHIDVEQVSLVVAPGLLISFQEAPGDVFEPVRQRLRSGKGRFRARGSDYLAYALLDAVVDSAFEVLEGLGERTEELETEVLERPTQATMRKIHALKRELLVLRRSVWPLRDLTGAFLRTDPPLVDPSTRVYLRDVQDHAYRLLDTAELLRDMASGMQELYLSSVSNRMNEVMKVLTVMASIFIPLTFIAGIYGMNFEYMPELGVRWAYPALLGAMGLAAGGMLVYFRVRRWI